ncbi:E3 ubiquitin-protein ligase E3D-like [Sinocyclocheilus rhinocerous]|uniref:E3 ubiquitin-protein ligase E3D-like n=1 Tax=Sinocyclocheilus rhinocerous TaxID=307959 RepID=UPI0007B7EF22|nr:PREDICTED: E3 ubiquitin-protein ligase E3D-like [Sinocyclocheilus rhinocerous]
MQHQIDFFFDPLSSDAVRDDADVKIESKQDSVLSVQTPDRTYRVKLTPAVSLLETSCQRSPGNTQHGSHFRLRLKVEQPTEAPCSVIGQLRVNVTYSFLCQSCGSMVLQDRTFGRVLPLPNGNWNALVDDWCCHPDPFANKKLLPREGDCLVGDTFLLLARDSSCEQTLVREENSLQKASAEQKRSSKHVMVSCRSCSAALGEEVTAVILWLLNTDALVASFPDAAARGDSFISADEVHQSCWAAQAVKVLYILCSDSKLQDVVDVWEKDISVHPLPLPQSSCEELQKLLMSSTSRLPAFLRCMNSYQVAYMQM